MMSRLHVEATGIADAVRAALALALPPLPAAPGHIYTLARGSSDHASSVIQRLFAHTGVAATTMPPSVLRGGVGLEDSAVLAVSQSGASPDLVEAAAECGLRGCPVLAIVNDVGSPLALAASTVLDQSAGEELAVAATKSVLCSIVIGARLAEIWSSETFDLGRLPARIEAVQTRVTSDEAVVDWFAVEAPMVVIGRGTGVGIAGEIALKVQELLGSAALAYSAAEVLHGPAGMIGPGFRVLALATGTERKSVIATAEILADRGADVLTLEDEADDVFGAPVQLCRIYLVLEQACRRLGRSPDSPPHLQKITRTR